MTSLHPYRAPDLLVSDQLRHATPFASLPTDPGDCLALLREGALFAVPGGIEVITAGDPAALLVVTEGRLCAPDGGRVWAAGSCLGIAETLGGTAFPAAVATAAPTILYRLDAARLIALLELSPALAARLLAGLSAPAPHHPASQPPAEGTDHAPAFHP